MRAPTYSALSSYAKRTSILSVGGPPSTGSFCRKSVTAGTSFHAASSTRPSTRMAPLATRTACACFRPLSGAAWAKEVDDAARHENEMKTARQMDEDVIRNDTA